MYTIALGGGNVLYTVVETLNDIYTPCVYTYKIWSVVDACSNANERRKKSQHCRKH